MVKSIVKDKEVLTQKSEKFVFGEDEQVIQDLIDTANEYKYQCAGLAAIQIGIPKKVIVINHQGKYIPYINPSIIYRSKQTYMIEERCLSVEGAHNVKRHKIIKLMWTTEKGKVMCKEIHGYLAQVLQHECDHLNGVLI